VREFTNLYFDGSCACCNKINNAETITLLNDNNLVWDKDFDSIRTELADLLTAIDRYVSRAGKQAIKKELDNLTNKLLGE
jgi:hypothetical protein